MRSALRLTGRGGEAFWRHPVVGAAWSPHAGDHAVHDDRVSAELTGVFNRPRHRLPTQPCASIEGEGTGRVDPPHRRAENSEQLVEGALLIGEHRPGQLQVRGQLEQRLWWTEPDRDELDAAAEQRALHLDQVLLAGQSIPVPDEGQYPDAGQVAHIHRDTGGGVRKPDPGQREAAGVLAQ